jgi:hypothetical protein
MRLINKISMISVMALVLVVVGASGVYAMLPHAEVVYGPQNKVILFSGNDPAVFGFDGWNNSYTANIVSTDFSFDSYVGSAPTMMILYDNYTNISTYTSPSFVCASCATEYDIASPWVQTINSNNAVNSIP